MITKPPFLNPLVHRDRRLGLSPSAWVRSFTCDDMGILIVGRGPVRKEAIDVFLEMGVSNFGILLSERDSIVYEHSLAPELRVINPEQVHRIPDYSGATKEERIQRIEQILDICRRHTYGFVFAGYGFMAEDPDFVRAIEDAGLQFIGPCAKTQEAAGRKDEAKRTAMLNGVSITPGLNNATALTILKKYPDRESLSALAKEQGLTVPEFDGKNATLEDLTEALLNAACEEGIDLYTIDELSETLCNEAARMLADTPGSRLRLKAIGGGGGKGQRILDDAEKVPGLVREILQEVKATGVGDNKNILLELNIEITRHNEIQMLGNGKWCVSLGGRDCSLQMHEQKLVEVSITQEELQVAIEVARREQREVEAKALEMELTSLQCMEAEAERFGQAVHLDSAATFECIVRGADHYLMEINTRIQVEHRVSELCYALRFTNPDDSSDYFDLNSLIEAMVLIEKHGARLPRPERIRREGAAIEVRLNATDDALSPHAGGVIVGWSDPIPGEVRDDQGISVTNQDTGQFIHYHLSGAYDSNIALLLATGGSRWESFRNISEILRRTTLRGHDLSTNLDFHYGLTNFFISQNVWAKPTTNFVTAYLTLVGLLKSKTERLDLSHASKAVFDRAVSAAESSGTEAVTAVLKALEFKQTLILRPMTRLLGNPHLLSAWLSEHRSDYLCDGTRVSWLVNPVEVLAATYHNLHMLDRSGAPAAHLIWDHDRELLDRALGFYRKIADRSSHETRWPDLDAALCAMDPQFAFEPELWKQVRSAHAGFQLGFELLSTLPLIAHEVGFHDLRVNKDLTVGIPKRLLDPELHTAMKRLLSPPPAVKSDEIAAVSGGVFYPQEAPGLPHFVEEGAHFNTGDTLYILEVMKMFNKVSAPFSGTVDTILCGESGTIVKKGQILFKVTPDEVVEVEDRKVHEDRVRTFTENCMGQLFGDG